MCDLRHDQIRTLMFYVFNCESAQELAMGSYQTRCLQCRVDHDVPVADHEQVSSEAWTMASFVQWYG